MTRAISSAWVASGFDASGRLLGAGDAHVFEGANRFVERGGQFLGLRADFLDNSAALFLESAIERIEPRVERLDELRAAHVDRLIDHAKALIDFLREMTGVVANTGGELICLRNKLVDKRAAAFDERLVDRR